MRKRDRLQRSFGQTRLAPDKIAADLVHRETQRALALGFSLLNLRLFESRTCDPLGYAHKVVGWFVTQVKVVEEERLFAFRIRRLINPSQGLTMPLGERLTNLSHCEDFEPSRTRTCDPLVKSQNLLFC